MATCLDYAGVAYPKTYHGNTIIPTEGRSLKKLFVGLGRWQDRPLFFEHEGNRAVRVGNWKLVSQKPENKWELYNIKTDRAEQSDVSAQFPDKVTQMIAEYNAWQPAQVLSLSRNWAGRWAEGNKGRSKNREARSKIKRWPTWFRY